MRKMRRGVKVILFVVVMVAVLAILSAFGEGGVETETIAYEVVSMDYVYSPEGETMGMSVVGVDADGGKVMFLDNTNYIDVGDKVAVTYEKGTYGEVVLAVQEIGKRD